MLGISAVLMAFGFFVLGCGILLLVLGLFSAARRMKIAGIVVSLVGLGIAAVPVFTFVYVAMAMRGP